MNAETTIMQTDLFDVCAKRHGGVSTSQAANLRVNKFGDRARILNFLKRFPNGATLDEICVALERTPNQISGRLSEMRMAGLIEKTEQKRATRTTCLASVWRTL